MTGKERLAECAELSDSELIDQLKRLAWNERLVVVKSVARLAEMHRRGSARDTAHPSLFQFGVNVLKYCEATAYRRAKVAEACLRYSVLLDLLESGEVTVTSVALIADHINFTNHQRLIHAARTMSRRELEREIAGLAPQNKPRETTRPIAVIAHNRAAPARTGAAATGLALPLGDSVELVAVPPRIEIRTEHKFTLGDSAETKLARARGLMRHKYPDGDIEGIFEEALDALLNKIDPERKAARARPDRTPRAAEDETRRIPEWVKRKVLKRDKGRCAFVSSNGERCKCTEWLEYDHIVPWPQGGRSDDPNNIRLLCRAHNQWLAEQRFGKAWRARLAERENRPATNQTAAGLNRGERAELPVEPGELEES